MTLLMSALQAHFKISPAYEYGQNTNLRNFIYLYKEKGYVVPTKKNRKVNLNQINQWRE